MKTNGKSSTAKADTLAERVAGYRNRAGAAGIPEQLQALEIRYAKLRARSVDGSVDDRDYFQQALALAATPATSAQQARAKMAFLIPYVKFDAVQGGHRLVAAMISAAVADENRRWAGSAGQQA